MTQGREGICFKRFKKQEFVGLGLACGETAQGRCGGRQGCKACCLHKTTHRKSMHLLQVGHRFASVLGGASDLGLLLESPGDPGD